MRRSEMTAAPKSRVARREGELRDLPPPRIPRQLHKQLRAADDIFVEDDLWNGVGAGDLRHSAEDLSPCRIVLDVEREVRDVVGG